MKYLGKDCSKVVKTIPGQSLSISEIIRRTMRGESLNLSSNYYYEESILPTDRLDVDVFDVKRMHERTKRELVKAKEAHSDFKHKNKNSGANAPENVSDESPIAAAGSAAKQAPEAAN